jgi:phosphate starvation-inducible protein PhoH and related proteins
VDDVHLAQLSSADVVRHRLVTDIVDAYARWDAVADATGARPVPNRSDRRRRR